MSNKIQTANQVFNFNGSDVRTTMIDNEVYFVGKDVTNILGYTNPQKAIRDHVEEEDKGVNDLFTPGGKQNLVVINESGLYSLILSSKLPSAKAFKRWVTSEVLPSIKKHGAYMSEDKWEKLFEGQDPAEVFATKYLETLGKLRIKEKEIVQIEDKLNTAEEVICEQQPYMDFAKKVQGSETNVDIGEMASILQNGKDIETGRNKLYKWLLEKNLVTKSNNGYRPTALASNIGVLETQEFTEALITNEGKLKTIIRVKPMVTPKGQMYILEKIKGTKQTERKTNLKKFF